MKKSSLIKLIAILMISMLVIGVANIKVYAADDDDDDDDFTVLTSNDLTSRNNTNTNTNTNTDLSDGTNTNTNTNTNSNTNSNLTNTNTNSSNTDLPKTGVEDILPISLLIVVFGISSVYAYKKVSDYRNI